MLCTGRSEPPYRSLIASHQPISTIPSQQIKITPMSQTTAIPSTSAPASSNFQSILQGALEQYNHNTKNDLLADPLFAKVNSCESPAQILSVLQGIVGQFDQRRRSGEWLTKLLNPTVHVLHAFSGAIGGGVSLVSPR